MGLFKRRKEEERAEEITFSSDGEGSELLISALGGNTKLTVNTALQVPAVAHCVDMIASAIAMLPIKLYRKDKDGQVKEITDDSRLEILNSKTGDTMNADNMRRMWVRDYLLTGSAYAYIERNVYAKPAALYYIPSDEVFVTKNSDDVIHKQFDYYVRGKRYEPYKLLKILRNSDGFGRGKGIIKENPLIIETMYNLIKFQKNQVLKGGNKKGFLKTAGTVGKNVIQDIKRGWNQLYSNENTENVMLLNGDIDFKEMSSTSVEMQLNENITTNNAEIMKLFGTLDGVLSETTVKNAVMPVIDAIEAALDSDLLLEAEKGSCYFAFDTRELTRGSIKERYSAYAVALANNFLQMDEVRAMEDLKPLGFNYIKLGLNDVLLDPKTGRIYTPNTNAMANLNDQSLSDTEEPAEVRGNGKNATFGEGHRFTGSESSGGGSGANSDLTNDDKSDIINNKEYHKEYDTSTLNSSNIEISQHAIERAAERGISKEAIINAIDHPIDEKGVKWDSSGRPSFQRIGEDATAAINPESKKLTSTWKTHTKLKNKLKGK